MSRNSRRTLLLLAVALLLPACGVDNSGGTLTPTVAPATPTGLAIRNGHYQVKLSWTPSPAASQYNVFRSLSSGGPYTPLAGAQAITATEIVDTGLSDGTAYHYVVSAVNPFGESGPSAEAVGNPGLRAVRIACGDGHTVVLLADGTLWAWGNNGVGQLGIASATITFSSVALPIAFEGAVSISSGSQHSFAIKADGTLWSWGNNQKGQLGIGTGDFLKPEPVQVVGLSDVVAATGGVWHSAALRSDGTVWVWGEYWGGETSIPVPMAGLSDVIAIEAGSVLTLALRSDGTVWSWSTSQSTATRIPNLTEVRRIAAGDNHQLALRNDGTLWGWGDGAYGQLGTVGYPSAPFPVQIPGLHGVTAISASWEYSVAIQNDDSVWAFGRNNLGQLGVAGPPFANAIPTRINGLQRIREVVAGTGFVIALEDSGAIWSWGTSFTGQLGGGTSSIQDIPVQVGNLTGASSISAGGQFSLAARTNGTAWSWGDNTVAQLGNGTTTSSYFRTAITPTYSSPVVQVSAGRTHGAARLQNGEVWAWGLTPSGGTVTSVLNPAKVGTLTGVTSVSSGLTYNLALVGSTGTLWFWGRNWNGVRANGTVGGDFPTPVTIPLTNVVKASAGHTHCVAIRSDQTVWRWGRSPTGPDTTLPVQVAGLTGMIDVSGGESHTLALKSDGTVWAWGGGSSGELGDGLRTFSATPVQAVGLPPIVQVSAGAYHSLALAADGTVWAWGGNDRGQIGRNTPYSSEVPLQVPGITGAVQVSAGANHSMARLANGTVFAWGENDYGQIGIGTALTSPTPLQVTR